MPVFDPEATVRLLLESIRASSADPDLAKGGRRQLRRLRASLTALHHADETLCAAYTGQALPLPAAAARVALHHRAAYAHLADAFQTLIQAEIRQRSSSGLILDTIGDVLNCLKNVLLISSLAFAAAPDGFWRRCHGLYALALRVGGIAAKRGDPVPLATLSDLYKHVLLLGLANTYAIPNRALLQLDRALTALACYATLSTNYEPGSARHGFAIALDQDTPPRNTAFAQRTNGAATLFLDTHDLVGFLKLGPRQAPPPLVQAGLRRWNVDWSFLDESRRHELAAAWNIHPRRRGPRNPSAARMLTTFGLTDTQALLQSSDRPSRRYPPATSLLQLSHPVAVVNESVLGTCLLWKADAPLTVSLGELVCLFQTTRAQKPWALGVVRWLKTVRAPYLMIGVQLMAPRAAPVTIRLQHTAGKYDRPLPGLLLPRTGAVGVSLLTPALLDEPGGVLTLTHGNGQQHVRLTHRVAATPCWSRFLFEPLKPFTAGAARAAHAPAQRRGLA